MLFALFNAQLLRHSFALLLLMSIYGSISNAGEATEEAQIAIKTVRDRLQFVRHDLLEGKLFKHILAQFKHTQLQKLSEKQNNKDVATLKRRRQEIGARCNAVEIWHNAMVVQLTKTLKQLDMHTSTSLFEVLSEISITLIMYEAEIAEALRTEFSAVYAKAIDETLKANADSPAKFREELAQHVINSIPTPTGIKIKNLQEKINTLVTAVLANPTSTFVPIFEQASHKLTDAEKVNIIKASVIDKALKLGIKKIEESLRDFGANWYNRAVRSAYATSMRKYKEYEYDPYARVQAGILGMIITLVPAWYFGGIGYLWAMKDTIKSAATGAMIARYSEESARSLYESHQKLYAAAKIVGLNELQKAGKYPDPAVIFAFPSGTKLYALAPSGSSSEKPIGLKKAYRGIIENFSIAARRMQAGDPNPCKGLKKVHIYFGPTGIGKTNLTTYSREQCAEIASELGVQVYYISLSVADIKTYRAFEFLEALSKEKFKHKALFIINLDEFHLMHANINGDTEVYKILLETLDSLNRNNLPFIITGSTNRPDLMPLDLWRRVEMHKIEPFRQKERFEFFEDRFKGTLGLTDYAILIKLRYYSQISAGMTPAALENIIKQLALVQQMGTKITDIMIENTILKAALNIQEEPRIRMTALRKAAAIHHFGKLIFTLESLSPEEHAKVKKGKRILIASIEKVTRPIEQNNKSIDITKSTIQTSSGYFISLGASKNAKISKEMQAKVAVAGYVAQRLISPDTIDANLLEEDSKAASSLCQELAANGMSLESAGAQRWAEILGNAETMRKEYEAEITEKLKPEIPLMKRLLEHMRRNGNPRINGVEVLKIKKELKEEAYSKPSSPTLPPSGLPEPQLVAAAAQQTAAAA